MDDTKKMLRTIINGQSAMKAELLVRIENLDKKLSSRIDSLESKMNVGFGNVDKKLAGLTKRVDKLGLQIARLEDDTPTINEFDKLERRVTKVEQKVAAI